MTNAIVMASGLGTRLRPITYKTPKPLVQVGGTPMIETTIQALQKSGVDHIYVVVGYLAEQFSYLPKKYPHLSLIKNPDYDSANNISSIFYAKDVLKKGNCFICEADLFVNNTNFLKRTLNSSGYFGKLIEGFSDDWVFDTDSNQQISRIGKRGTDCFNMVGFSYFAKKDALILADKISKAYQNPGCEKLFWDEVVNQNLDVFDLKVFPVEKSDLFEIDTIDDLNKTNRMIEYERRKFC